MDLDRVLAKFTAPGPIESRADLDRALEELIAILATSREDIALLLDILVSGRQGLLEAILTSSRHHAFTFRDRLAKALRKSLATSTPIFRSCADKLGAFLITIPPDIVLDRSVMEDYNAYATLTTELDSVEAEQNIPKLGPLVPTSASKLGKRESRHAKTSSAKPTSESALKTNSPSSSGPTAVSNLPKLLTTFLEIEEFAIDNLLRTLTPGDPSVSWNVTPKGSASPDPVPGDSAPIDSPLKPKALSRLHYLSIKQEDIIKYLNHASKPKSGNWPVVVSQRGIKRMREYVADKKDFSESRKEDQLSVGFFPPQNQTMLLQNELGVPIYTADLGDCLCLIYHIDFGAPTGTSQESQFIRIFGVFHESEVDVKFWGSVAAQLARRGREYIERCTDREATRIRFKGVETVPPKLSPPLDVSQWNKEGADIEVDKSHFLEENHLHALSYGGSGHGRKRIAANGEADSGRTGQLLQTERNEAVATPEAQMPGLSLLDMDEDAEDNGSLPSKFSELNDSHFPVFLTYDQLCKLLEADYELQFNPSTNLTALGAARAFRGIRKQGSARQPLISFEYFESNIWPHLNEGVKRGLHPILVYSEFMGIIKGSEASRNYPKNFLDRQAYESQSSRTHSGDPTERSRIYTLFEAYCKLRPPSSYDAADRVHTLLAEVEEKGLPGDPVDFLYVDEAQDHLILEAACELLALYSIT
ncbi:hypothetical protein FRC00_008567 [Tulasnella sp. 408]|nr:hypothetical protein FRC00_008567 [Tulasnella sp. 408]